MRKILRRAICVLGIGIICFAVIIAVTSKRRANAVDAVRGVGGEVWYSYGFEVDTVGFDVHGNLPANATPATWDVQPEAFSPPEVKLRMQRIAARRGWQNTFDSVYGIRLEGRTIPSQVFQQMNRLTDVRWLSLSHSKFDPADLQTYLQRTKHLKWLILSDTKVDAGCLSGATAIPTLTWLDLSGTHIDDNAVRHLNGNMTLKTLDLSNTKLTDDGIRQLTRLPRLRELRLNGTKIGDTAMSSLVRLSRLQVLRLSETNITNRGLKRLESLRTLRFVDVLNTKVTHEAIHEFQRKHPSVRIVGGDWIAL